MAVLALILAVLVVLYAASAARVVRQYEKGLVFRLGRLQPALREPGFTMIVPAIDRLQKVNMQIVTLPVPAQEGITRDNVTVRVDAVVYFRVIDPADAVVRVEDYRFAVSQMAQTSLRSIIGKSELDDLLSNREKLNQGLAIMIDSPAVEWGVNVDRVEIKDVSLPETMKRSMARQAEAQRDRRARVINADAEFEASKKLAEAAKAMADTPAALQLRLLQTVSSVATEKNSTLVLPFPVELLRFLDRSQHTGEDPPRRPRERRETTDGSEAAGDSEAIDDSPAAALAAGDPLGLDPGPDPGRAAGDPAALGGEAPGEVPAVEPAPQNDTDRTSTDSGNQ